MDSESILIFFGRTNLPITLFKMLDKFHQVCRVSDDFKVEFFY